MYLKVFARVVRFHSPPITLPPPQPTNNEASLTCNIQYPGLFVQIICWMLLTVSQWPFVRCYWQCLHEYNSGYFDNPQLGIAYVMDGKEFTSREVLQLAGIFRRVTNIFSCRDWGFMLHFTKGLDFLMSGHRGELFYFCITFCLCLYKITFSTINYAYCRVRVCLICNVCHIIVSYWKKLTIHPSGIKTDLSAHKY